MKNKPNLLLVVPNFRWCVGDKNTYWHYIPYNLCILASMVKDICNIKIIDAYNENLTKDQFSEMVRKSNPDVVGITVLMDQFAGAGHNAAEIVKSINPKINVIMGGVYVTVNPDLAMEDKNIDYVVIGEGEYVLGNLIEYIIGAKPCPSNGICYRNKNGIIVNNGRTEFIANLDLLPLPSYDLIKIQNYIYSWARKSVDAPKLFPFGRVITSRGCPQKCCFCQVEHISGRKYRYRSAANVLKEIKWLKEKYKIRSLIFDDDNLFTNKQRAKDIFHGMIEQNLTMPWISIATAVFKLDSDLLMLMKKSGCCFIDVAIESGTNRILNEIIHKPVSLEHAKKMVAMARSAGIFVAANFIIGFPTETWDEIRQSLRFAEDLNANYVKIFTAIPLKNTELWEMCKKGGFFKKGFDSDNVMWSTGQIETDSFTHNDLTILRAYEWDRINFNCPQKRKITADQMGIDEEELNKIRRDTLNNIVKLIK